MFCLFGCRVITGVHDGQGEARGPVHPRHQDFRVRHEDGTGASKLASPTAQTVSFFVLFFVFFCISYCDWMPYNCARVYVRTRFGFGFGFILSFGFRFFFRMISTVQLLCFLSCFVWRFFSIWVILLVVFIACISRFNFAEPLLIISRAPPPPPSPPPSPSPPSLVAWSVPSRLWNVTVIHLKFLGNFCGNRARQGKKRVHSAMKTACSGIVGRSIISTSRFLYNFKCFPSFVAFCSTGKCDFFVFSFCVCLLCVFFTATVW